MYEWQDDELDRLHELFASVGQLSRPEPDISAADWLRQEGVSERMLDVADACYANDFGCSLHQLGMSEMITENQRWDSGAPPGLLQIWRHRTFVAHYLVNTCCAAFPSCGFGIPLWCRGYLFDPGSILASARAAFKQGCGESDPAAMASVQN